MRAEDVSNCRDISCQQPRLTRPPLGFSELRDVSEMPSLPNIKLGTFKG